MLTGRAFKFGDDISTDLIIPGKYSYLRSNLPELAKHVMEDADTTFVSRVKEGDFIVGGSNFGLGSSREHAPLVIKMAGVKAILAKSVARIFFRNAINLGLPAVVAPQASLACAAGDELEIDLVAGEIRNLTQGRVVEAASLDPRAVELIAAGGLIPYLKRKYAA